MQATTVRISTLSIEHDCGGFLVNRHGSSEITAEDAARAAKFSRGAAMLLCDGCGKPVKVPRVKDWNA